LKHGIGINGARLADFANTKALCEDDLILENHGDSDARDPCRSQLALGELLQFRRGGLDLFENEFICPTQGRRQNDCA
jgi:hypothetical protein